MNLGLAWMVFVNLFPLGVLQLGDSVANGYWHARSIEFFRDHALIEWLRLPGDVLFIAGVVPLVYMTVRAVFRPRPRAMPAPTPDGTVENAVVRRSAPGSEHRPHPRVARHERRGCLFTLPVDLEVWLLLAYATTVLVGAKVTELLARVHFARARRIAETGFAYDADADHYECPQGERLPLHVLDEDKQVAVYRAPAATCAGCPRKAACTPHDEGRHLYRPLAEWAETDVGRFHQWLSVLMAGSVTVLGVATLVRWAGRPGTGLLLIALVVAAAALIRDGRAAWAWTRGPADAEQ